MRGPRGSLIDCAHLLLALVEAGQPLQVYIVAAQSVADMMLRRLYDYRSGAFFERNSPDVEQFSHGDEVNLDKPVTENGIAAFGLLARQSPLPSSDSSQFSSTCSSFSLVFGCSTVAC